MWYGTMIWLSGSFLEYLPPKHKSESHITTAPLGFFFFYLFCFCKMPNIWTRNVTRSGNIACEWEHCHPFVFSSAPSEWKTFCSSVALIESRSAPISKEVDGGTAQEELERTGLSAVGLMEDGVRELVLHSAARMLLSLSHSVFTSSLHFSFTVCYFCPPTNASTRAFSQQCAPFLRHSNEPSYFRGLQSLLGAQKDLHLKAQVSQRSVFPQNENLLSSPESFACKPRSLSR